VDNVYLIRYAEPAVKGSYTRSRMISRLISNIRKALSYRNEVIRGVNHEWARIILHVDSHSPIIEEVLSRLFGVKSFSPAYKIDSSDLSVISEYVKQLFCSKIENKEFMVRVRRTGNHQYTSKDAEREIGGFLFDNCNPKRVNLTSPDYAIYVEIRGNTSYIYDRIIKGPGGLPVGSESKVLSMFSGGFDSTVASWMVMKRGSPVDLVYYDFGTEENWSIALKLAEKLYEEHVMNQFPMRLYKVDFHETAKTVSEVVRKNYRILVIRRLMFQHAAKLALSNNYLSIVTGESLGQVSSQTVESMYVTSSHLQVPVLRPVIGLDKDEIIAKTIELGLYEIASRQKEFCSIKGIYASPRPDPSIFNEELLKVTLLLEDLWPPKINVFKIG
jgi:thiamine biosynthesis protein ThiI